MTQTKKMLCKNTLYPAFSVRKRHFGYKPLRNRVKIPPALAVYRGNFCPKKYVGKELDMETGLYYYGAMYLDPKVSRWLSGDPAVGEYIPSAPVNDEVRKQNQNLPGMGGVFNYVNLHVYHYAGNNPVKLVDPDGESVYSFRQRDNYYTFFVESSVIEGAIFGSAGFVNGLGIGYRAALNIAGFTKIEIDAARALLEQAKNNLGDAADGIQIAALFTRDLVGNAATLKNLANNLGLLIAVYDTTSAIVNQQRIGADSVINSLWGGQLSAKSHNGVAALYAYALQRFNKLVESGDIQYTVNALGVPRITKSSSVDVVRQELRELRNLMNQNPER